MMTNITEKGATTTETPLTESKDSQSKAIKEYLLTGKSLTAIDGLRLFKCWSLTQRVFDLRMKGLPIITEMIQLESGKRVAKYTVKSSI